MAGARTRGAGADVKNHPPLLTGFRRSAVTGKDADRFNFKVPTLRNVELTYPYFHDGAANTLTEAVDTMGLAPAWQKVYA